jgi:sulfate adenylyltransferase subunit 1
MVTGASTSQLSIILIDARKGIVSQTYRHFFINNLLRIKNVIVAINKMDLVDFSESVFNEIKSDFLRISNKRDFKEQKITFIPISALNGDNVVSKSDNMPWYDGCSLLNYLENVKEKDIFNKTISRFPVQYVIRPRNQEFHDFRGYAGKVYGGDLSVGDDIVVLPSNKRTKIKGIYFFNEKYDTATRGSSVYITLNDQINVSRGDMIVKAGDLPRISNKINAVICWMDEKKLTIHSKYILQHGVNRVIGLVNEIYHKINPDYSGIDSNIISVEMNDIAKISFELNSPIFFDEFLNQRANGSFILIDELSNNTVGVGFIQ